MALVSSRADAMLADSMMMSMEMLKRARAASGDAA